MALGSAGLTGTGGSHDLYVPEIWSKEIQSAFEKATIAKPLCLDMSSLLSDAGGDIIRVPKLANRTATTRTLTDLSQITPVGATENQFSMNIQTWATDYEAVSDALSAQTKLFRMGKIDGKMKNSIAVKFDTDLFANYSSLTASKGTDDGATRTSFDDIADALATLDSNNVPKSDRVIVLTPNTFWGFVKDKTIASGDFFDQKAMESGSVPMLGGVKVAVSNNLPTSAGGSKVNLVLHKEAFAFGIAQEARVRMEHNLSYMSTIIVGDMIYGSGCYRAEAGVKVYGL